METKRKKREQKRTTHYMYIPEHIICNILSRLPAESLHKFRYACNQWFNLIKHPQFIKEHLLHSKPCLLIQDRIVTKRSLFDTQLMSIEGANIRVRDLSRFFTGQIRASCNGLLLVQNWVDYTLLHITNPITGQWLGLPPCNGFIASGCTFGLAFVPSTADYKVVCIFRHWYGIKCQILSLRGCFNGRCNDTWRDVNGPLSRLTPSTMEVPILVNGGILHWKTDSRSHILSLDCSNETFQRTPLPKCKIINVHLLEMGGFLAFVNIKHTRIDIWVLKDYSGKRWIKQYYIDTVLIRDVVPTRFLHCIKPLVSLGKGEEMIFSCSNCLFCYNVKLGRAMKIDQNISQLVFYAPHVNSSIFWTIKRASIDM
ncbi:PREDICTED: F-box protein At3g07870-like [Nelumbo nucifera]|uniref:F-box domain-containing protein n=2 Tax=Nelumbo nucifera TaxID=4432 RepID=A0A822YBH3_NELNU|nr:PREDICTED: F-box protein At3g07870-like [Nelumbo nucifera]DAD28406.1 TPA_asm: hypothetical protein HUJ06_029874 [Nelumbo nucifera]